MNNFLSYCTPLLNPKEVYKKRPMGYDKGVLLEFKTLRENLVQSFKTAVTFLLLPKSIIGISYGNPYYFLISYQLQKEKIFYL